LVLDLLILYFLWYERISSVATYFLPSLSAYNNDMRSCLQMSPTTRRARRQAFYCMVSLVVVYCNQTVFYYGSRSCQLFLSVREDVYYIISLIPIMKNSYSISLQYLVPFQ